MEMESGKRERWEGQTGEGQTREGSSLFFLAPKQIEEAAGRGAPAWPAVSVWSLNPQIVPGARRSRRHLSESHIGCRGGRRGGRGNGAAPSMNAYRKGRWKKRFRPFGQRGTTWRQRVETLLPLFFHRLLAACSLFLRNRSSTPRDDLLERSSENGNWTRCAATVAIKDY